ncbi:hypothetical protein KM043_008284 [Ampulex compressa]|nr:hypothetical protein KM043_008284 [Ampulex compressa]
MVGTRLVAGTRVADPKEGELGACNRVKHDKPHRAVRLLCSPKAKIGLPIAEDNYGVNGELEQALSNKNREDTGNSISFWWLAIKRDLPVVF